LEKFLSYPAVDVGKKEMADVKVNVEARFSEIKAYI